MPLDEPLDKLLTIVIPAFVRDETGQARLSRLVDTLGRQCRVVVVDDAGVCVTVTVRLMLDSSRVNQPGPVAVTVHVPFAVALILPEESIEHTPGVDDA